MKRIARWEQLKPGEFAFYGASTKDRKRISRTYFFVDYPATINAIKYKVFKLGKLLDQDVAPTESRPYKCPGCQHKYTTMDILVLNFNADRLPMCEYCGETVIPDEEVKVETSNQSYVKFMNETKQIVELLKKIDQLTLPE